MAADVSCFIGADRLKWRCRLSHQHAGSTWPMDYTDIATAICRPSLGAALGVWPVDALPIIEQEAVKERV